MIVIACYGVQKHIVFVQAVEVQPFLREQGSIEDEGVDYLQDAICVNNVVEDVGLKGRCRPVLSAA